MLPTHQDDIPSRPPTESVPPDAHGEAALALVESLIHGILARGGLSLTETLEIAQTAVDAQVEICVDRSEEPTTAPSVRLLQAIAASLMIDVDPIAPHETGASATGEGLDGTGC